MATHDNLPGLLSKMAQFVRHPTKSWFDSEAPESLMQESDYSKKALKAVIERKRKNDLIRSREFEYLRKLRRNGPCISPDAAGHPSAFQTSILSNMGERAITLKKIDDIEAQMSKQWWRGKTDATPVGVPRAPAVRPPLQTTAKGTGTGTFASTQAALQLPDANPLDEADYVTTQMSEKVAHDLAANPTASLKLRLNEGDDPLSDPDLEEAAIRFANGDEAGAEAGLLAALQADEVSADLASQWAAGLFDLYRATGQQASFDCVAIDYAQRFGCSAPAWFSTPDLLGYKVAASPRAKSVASKPREQVVWVCPALLDVLALKNLPANWVAATAPGSINWQSLQTISPEAIRPLADIMAQWCLQPVSLHFIGADSLQKTLQSLTPLGDKSVEAACWQLRLDALRILCLHDAFEAVALDYCVTYEVSPPAWQPALCACVLDDATPAIVTQKTSDFVNVAVMDDVAGGVALTGEVVGDAQEVLDYLQSRLQTADRLVISCAQLIRVDFSAAGSILNWVAAREAEGCEVQFHDVPCLVAAFFKVVGINEHARVILRSS